MPRIPIGIWQLSPAARSISPVEFSPQSANVTDIEHSGTACAEDAGVTLDAARMSARAAAPDDRVVTMLVLMQGSLLKMFGAEILQRGSKGGKGLASTA
ncbi:hypothetical protein BraRD5C2_07800 [Bradyrhizobium sp. RD5-C2]|nr:hypothetical protein BraRD5C2_07800 [Bradyrhizobium sp. RD5-C2]